MGVCYFRPHMIQRIFMHAQGLEIKLRREQAYPWPFIHSPGLNNRNLRSKVEMYLGIGGDLYQVRDYICIEILLGEVHVKPSFRLLGCESSCALALGQNNLHFSPDNELNAAF